MHAFMRRPAFAFATTAILLALSACAPRTLRPDREVGADDDPLTIHTIPVGAGNCQVMECPSQNKLVVFDCGTRGRGDLGWSAEEVADYIDDLMNANTEVTVSVSHADIDHYRYLPTIFDDRTVDSIVLGEQSTDYNGDFQTWIETQTGDGADLIEWIGEYTSDEPEDALSCWVDDGHGGWEIDAAAYILVVNAGHTSNANSMVVAVRYGTFQTLFTGDMTGATEAAIDDGDPVTLSETAVITGAHHGVDTEGSNSVEWADANQAQLTMFSTGTRDLHPRCESVDHYTPWVLGNASNHDYQCGEAGAYEERDTDEAVLVTNDNGLIKVYAYEDGTFQYQWTVGSAAGALVRR